MRTTIVVAFFLMLIVPAHAAVINAVANGDWDDPTTWDSNPSIPGAGDEVHINGFTVDVDANADCFSLDIYNGSSLRFMANVGLDLNGGNITVYSGGSIDRNSTTAHHDFDNSATDSVIVQSTGTITIEDIQINAAVNLVLFGAGSITLSDDLLFQTSKATVTNNMSGSLNLTGANSSSVWFTNLSDTCTFINLQTMTVSRYLYIESAGNTVTNSGSIDFNNSSFGIFITNGDGDGTTMSNSGTIHVAGDVSLGNADMDFNNTGTLDVDGDFGTISSNTNLYNFAGATLRWAGTAYGGMRLFTHYSGSSVIYDRSS
ncbi:MAG: hypothetical protein AAGB22_14670, partial [Bacteroidota bacterium]